MLAKCEGTADLVGLEEFEVVALCETARGVLAAPEVAALPNVSALMWGAEDLVASLGGSSSRHPDGRYRDVATHARSHVLLAAGAHGVAAIDTVHLEIGDLEGLRAEAEDAAAIGVRIDRLHPPVAGRRRPGGVRARPRARRVGPGGARRRGHQPRGGVRVPRGDGRRTSAPPGSGTPATGPRGLTWHEGVSEGGPMMVSQGTTQSVPARNHADLHPFGGHSRARLQTIR